jgi:hypothetical protein
MPPGCSASGIAGRLRFPLQLSAVGGTFGALAGDA